MFPPLPSGVVACLFCGIALNHFVRPLMDLEGKRYSFGTVKTLAQVWRLLPTANKVAVGFSFPPAVCA